MRIDARGPCKRERQTFGVYAEAGRYVCHSGHQRVGVQHFSHV